jgi:hypothetical protein
MRLPFTADQFFGVFARYNAAAWPVVAVLWLAAVFALVGVVVRPGSVATRRASIVLVTLWAWGGVVYHAAFFTAINPAAWLFAALFVVEALLIGWYGLRLDVLAFGRASGARRVLGVGLATYALLYPGLTAIAGHVYPAAPTFGVPCPTGIYTIGLILTLPTVVPVAIVIVPAIWALIGGSAALVLGVSTDYVLLACALVLPFEWLARTRAARI